MNTSRIRLITGMMLALLVLLPPLLPDETAAAQSRNDFNLGNQLLRDGEFEEAYEVFRKLMEENPRSFAVYDRAVSALINLKRYEDAIAITEERLENFATDVNTMVRLGEIYHIRGDKDEARDIWYNVLDRHSDNNNAFRRIAETMNDHRQYRDAIEVYKKAREQFNDPGMFGFDIADNYLAVNEFESAIEEYLDILADDERQKNRIQRQLLNYDEQQLYDTAIMLTEERFDQLQAGSSRDLAYRDFLVWLNMERGFYRRALAAARTLERYSDNERHAVFRVGRQLRSHDEFELAADAFSYYQDLERHPLKARSLEELSRAYQDWAAHLIDNNLDFGGGADSLYRKAFQSVEQLTGQFPQYDRRMQTLVIQSELALDHLKEPELARSYFEKMENAVNDTSDEAQMHYIEGRLLLYQGDFQMARVSLTRSNRISGSGDTAEKSRYYLGLGDFYNGDFSYSRMQLRSLERENHSYFANNALQLRYLIQNAHDENGENRSLKRYAKARYLYDTGRYNESAELLAPIIEEAAEHPLQNDSSLLLARSLRQIHPEIAFRVIDRHMRRPSVARNAGERMLWKRARLAEVVFVMQQRATGDESGFEWQAPAGLLDTAMFSGEQLRGALSGETSLLTLAGVVDYYEELLIRYPDGYYSDLTRDRIRKLERREHREL